MPPLRFDISLDSCFFFSDVTGRRLRVLRRARTILPTCLHATHRRLKGFLTLPLRNSAVHGFVMFPLGPERTRGTDAGHPWPSGHLSDERI